jgi:ATP-dependent exoDNAse (exonuclease V) alpha subunit
MQQLQQLSVDSSSGDIVIPITIGTARKSNLEYSTFTYATGNILNPFASVEVEDIFPFNLQFAMTVHKAKGRTICRVVIDLTDRQKSYGQMKYASVFVAMSRVRCMDHVRLICHAKHQNIQKYLYLSRSQPADCVMAFYNGF